MKKNIKKDMQDLQILWNDYRLKRNDSPASKETTIAYMRYEVLLEKLTEKYGCEKEELTKVLK